MKIRMISHASVIIETSDCKIWTDPWLFGKAFNDSWALLMLPAWQDAFYDEIDYLWISHEHPDHFHIETLKAMPTEFKERVTVLFQRNNSDKVPKALKAFGFKNIQLMQHRQLMNLTRETQVYNCQIGQMDSVLGVINQGTALLNVNDCEINAKDCRYLVEDLGKINIVLNQFSIAGYNGDFEYAGPLSKLKQRILDGLIANHKDLQADVTVPFASFVYFSCEDNQYVNEFANTPGDVYSLFEQSGLKCAVLYAGDELDSEKPYDSQSALAKFEQLYQQKEQLQYSQPEPVSIDKIQEAVRQRSQQLREKYPKFFLNKLKPVNIKVPDLNLTVELCLAKGTCKPLPETNDFDLQIYSQPLHFAFATPWGLQTLGVSARYLIKSNKKTWKWYRIITSLNNAEVFLKPKYLLASNNLNYFRARLYGGLNQLIYQLQRMN